MNSLMGGWVADRLKKVRELPGQTSGPEVEGKSTRAERIAEDIHRDLEEREQKKGGS